MSELLQTWPHFILSYQCVSFLKIADASLAH
jgi:hypothetical protein